MLVKVNFAYLGPGKAPGSPARSVGELPHAEEITVPIVFSVLFRASVAASVSWDIRRNERDGLRRVLFALGSLILALALGYVAVALLPFV